MRGVGLLVAAVCTVAGSSPAHAQYTISTVAGSAGAAGCTGNGGAGTSAKLGKPRGIALDGSGNLVIADNGCNSFRRVNLGSGTISLLAGDGTCGLLNGTLAAARFGQGSH